MMIIDMNTGMRKVDAYVKIIQFSKNYAVLAKR
jgi:hypothetical protein